MTAVFSGFRPGEVGLRGGPMGVGQLMIVWVQVKVRLESFLGTWAAILPVGSTLGFVERLWRVSCRRVSLVFIGISVNAPSGTIHVLRDTLIEQIIISVSERNPPSNRSRA